MDRSLVSSRGVVFSACCLVAWILLPVAHGQQPELPPVGGGDRRPELPPVGSGEQKPPPASINNPGGRARLGEPDAGVPSAPPFSSRGGGGDLEFVEKVIE